MNLTGKTIIWTGKRMNRTVDGHGCGQEEVK